LYTATEAIAKKISDLTSDYQLGFGSFSDKPVTPFGNPSSSTYSFKHHLNLTTDTDKFSRNVENSGNQSNIDHPESGIMKKLSRYVPKFTKYLFM
jgi:hypothetical protein